MRIANWRISHHVISPENSRTYVANSGNSEYSFSMAPLNSRLSNDKAGNSIAEVMITEVLLINIIPYSIMKTATADNAI